MSTLQSTKSSLPPSGVIAPPKIPISAKLGVGALAGIFGTSCIFPLDVVKTRLQGSAHLYSGPLDCVRKVLAAEGPRGFYKG